MDSKQEVRREYKHDIYNNHRGFIQMRRWMNRESLFEIVLMQCLKMTSATHNTHIYSYALRELESPVIVISITYRYKYNTVSR